VSEDTDQPEPPAGTPDGSEATTCYRHPEREAHVRCTRCNRRICPDCMIEASVGFQCPECVREGNKNVREARTHFGGRVTSDAGLVTKVLIGVNVVVYFMQRASGSFTSRFELIGAFPPPPNVAFLGVADGEYYRLITSAFMHGGLLHIGLNMYALYLFGPTLESTLGRVRFLALYLLSALGGSAMSYAFNAPQQASLGASGAVFGLLGAFFVVNRKLGRDTSGLIVLVAINFAFGFLAPNIDWRAHLGGLISGALIASALVYAPRSRRTLVQVAGCAVVLLAIVALVAWRTADLTMVEALARTYSSVT
jgi:membrane associated rhomboid family serine protease